jgi:diguanylate cyclase (GGDEF)-like protein
MTQDGDDTLELRILQYINDRGTSVNKYNLIGRGGPGELELSFGKEWSVDQKVAAAQAFDELRNRRLIQSTLSDLVDPENWVAITDAGREALTDGTIQPKAPQAGDERSDQRETLTQFISDELKLNRPTALIYADLDNFKGVNDVLGHDAGDRCIEAFMQILNEIVEGRGRAFRAYGRGDEFVLVLPNCTAVEAKATAERIRRIVESGNIGGSIAVTASLGVCESEFGLVADASGLINRAEKLMRAAKATKNAVVCAEGPTQKDAPARLSQALTQWMSESTARWETVVSQIPAQYPMGYFVHGTWSFAYAIDANQRKLSVKGLFELLRDLPRQGRCLHPWRFPLSVEKEPYAYDGTVECWPVAPPDNDSPWYWRASPELKLFYLRRHEEDENEQGRSTGTGGTSILLHLPIWRIGECVLHAARLAQALSLSSGTVIFRARWTRIRNRRLVVEDPSRCLDRDYICRQESIESTAAAGIAQVEGELHQIVAELLKPFYEGFGFFQPSTQLLEEELSRMLENCA